MIHTTLSPEIARGYAKGKGAGVLIEIETRSSEVMFDYRGARRCFPDLSKGQLDYFDNAQEVLLFKDAVFSAKIIEVNIP